MIIAVFLIYLIKYDYYCFPNSYDYLLFSLYLFIFSHFVWYILPVNANIPIIPVVSSLKVYDENFNGSDDDDDNSDENDINNNEGEPNGGDSAAYVGND